MNEYECQCGYVWIDDHNYGCPMCGKQDDVIRRDYRTSGSHMSLVRNTIGG